MWKLWSFEVWQTGNPSKQTSWLFSVLQYYSLLFSKGNSKFLFHGIYNKNNTKNFIAAAIFCSHQLSQCVNNSLIKMKACSVRLELAPYVLVSTHLALVNSKGVIAENYFLKTPFLCLQWLLGGERNRLSKGNGINSFTQAIVFCKRGDGFCVCVGGG